MNIDYMNTPVGLLKISATKRGVRSIKFVENFTSESVTTPITIKCKLQLQEYFLGKRHAFSLPLDMRGSKLEISIWECLAQIPFGNTASWRDFALSIDKPSATRSFNTARDKNPINIIIPCHRVNEDSGSMAGYSGGRAKKAWLLSHEALSSRL